MKKLLLLSLLVLFGCSKDDNKGKLFERLEDKVFIPENSSLENANQITEFAEYFPNMPESRNALIQKFIFEGFTGPKCFVTPGFNALDASYEIEVHSSDYMRMRINDDGSISVAILGENPLRVSVKVEENFESSYLSRTGMPNPNQTFKEISRDDVRTITERWGCLQYYF